MVVDPGFNVLTGLASLLFLLGMLYFGFVLMRIRSGPWEQVFFWAAVCQVVALCLVAAVALVSRVVGNSLLAEGGVNWMWVASAVLKGVVLLSALTGAVALLGSTKRSR